jgi:hypothetical protein
MLCLWIVQNPALCEVGQPDAVPVKQAGETIECLLGAAQSVNLADGGRGSIVECAAGYCSACQAVLVQLLQHQV